MNALLCVGCNTYDHLRQLCAAESDAAGVFNVLFKENSHYDPTRSRLLLSPTSSTVKDALDAIFPRANELDVFTFYFAGHAGVKSGSFYLCTRESDADRLSTTSVPIVDVFSMLNEFLPRKVNVIVDACQAGGSSFDLSHLLKPEIIGSTEAPSITFLGACSAKQLAGETSNGGIMTKELIKCLTGETEIRTNGAFLDLTEVATAVSQMVQAQYPDQKPVSWGLSLFGKGRLARNPHFRGSSFEPNFPSHVAPRSKIGLKVRTLSPALWSEYRAVQEDLSPRRLLDLLDNVVAADDDIPAMVSFVDGFASTFGPRASGSAELLGHSICLATCVTCLLPHVKADAVKAYIRKVLREVMELDTAVFMQIRKALKAGDHALLGEAGVVADLYYLPLRITKLLGWIGSSIVTEALFPDLRDGNDANRFHLAGEIVDQYQNAMVVVSDEQAPALYLFLKACLITGQTRFAERVANLYFASFAGKSGNVTRSGVDGAQALRYILSLTKGSLQTSDWRPANPSHLLPVLLLFGAKLGLGSTWDLRTLDRKSTAFFVPQDYCDFGRKVIERGTNYTHRIGFGVWTLSEFLGEFDRAINALPSDTIQFPKEGAAVCALSSLLFPDRLPLVLEKVIP